MARCDIMNDRIDCKSLHQSEELFRSHGTEFIGISWPGEMSGFNTLV